MMVAIALMTGVIATAQENKSCQEKCCKEQSCQEKCCKEQSCKEKCCKEKCCKEKPCKEQCCESKGKCKDKAEMVRCQTQRMVEKYGLNEEQAARLQALNEEYAGKLPKPGMRGPGMRPGPGKHGPRPEGGPGMGPRPEGGFKPKEGERPQMTEEQKAARKAAMEKRHEEMKKIFEEREKAQAEYDAALKEILTRKQFKAYMKERENRQEHRPGPKK